MTGLDRRWWEPRRLYWGRLRRSLDPLTRAGMQLVFIAGCARSGTTLLRSLMGCFQGATVCPTERGLEAFLEMASLESGDATLVVKRTHSFHRQLHRLPASVDLVYCVRHPGDCLTSTHEASVSKRRFHVTRDRWIREYESLRRLERLQPGRPITFVRYEDLVADPDGVQADLATRLGLVINRPFSRNGIGVTIHRRSVDRWRDEGMRQAAIEALSWPNGHSTILGPLPSHGQIVWQGLLSSFCRRFGYRLEQPGGESP